MPTSEQTSKLTAALCKAQGMMRPAVFDKINPHFKNKYASLASIFDSVRLPFATAGLSFTQSLERFHDDGGSFPCLVTRLHFEEEWISSVYPLPNGGVKPQDFGSALTYARRYSLSALCGIAADEDDDASAASKPTVAVPTITEAQAEELLAAIDNNGVPGDLFKTKWLDSLGITSVHQLPANEYAGAIKACKDWGAKQRKAKP